MPEQTIISTLKFALQNILDILLIFREDNIPQNIFNFHKIKI